jgi:arylsulfatase A-like enzyme
MKRDKRLDDTWVLLVSDHGEEIFDHGSFDHGHAYEDEVTRVPLILRAPGGKWRAGSRVTTSVRHIDILPTVLALFGQPLLTHFEGESLMPVIEEKETAKRPAYIEFNLFHGQQCALFDGRYKIIWDTRRKRGYYYDLEADPKELTKLDSDQPRYLELFAELEKLRNKLADTAKDKVFDKGELSKEAAEALKSLGYIR